MHRRWWVPVLLAIVAAAGAQADIPEVEAHQQTVDRPPTEGGSQVDELIRRRDVSGLRRLALDHRDAAVRGWAIVGLAEIDGARASEALTELTSAPELLVRTWAAAARIRRASTLAEVRELAPLRQSLPALERPLRLRVKALARGASLRDLLELSREPSLTAVLRDHVLEHDARDLVDIMMTHSDDQMRRQAAGFLAVKGQEGREASEVPRLVLSALTLPRRRGERTPWHGGALFVPAVSWSRPNARELVRSLIGWWLALDGQGRQAETQPVWNNLYSVGLLSTAGYDRSIQANAPSLVKALVKVEGRSKTRALLEQVGLGDDPRLREFVR